MMASNRQRLTWRFWVCLRRFRTIGKQKHRLGWMRSAVALSGARRNPRVATMTLLGINPAARRATELFRCADVLAEDANYLLDSLVGLMQFAVLGVNSLLGNGPHTPGAADRDDFVGVTGTQ